jgi:hypothetical protein
MSGNGLSHALTLDSPEFVTYNDVIVSNSGHTREGNTMTTASSKQIEFIKSLMADKFIYTAPSYVAAEVGQAYIDLLNTMIKAIEISDTMTSREASSLIDLLKSASNWNAVFDVLYRKSALVGLLGSNFEVLFAKAQAKTESRLDDLMEMSEGDIRSIFTGRAKPAAKRMNKMNTRRLYKPVTSETSDPVVCIGSEEIKSVYRGIVGMREATNEEIAEFASRTLGHGHDDRRTGEYWEWMLFVSIRKPDWWTLSNCWFKAQGNDEAFTPAQLQINGEAVRHSYAMARDVTTAAEIARELGLSESAVRKACDRGTFPPTVATKAGGTWLLVRDAALAHWGKDETTGLEPGLGGESRGS